MEGSKMTNDRATLVPGYQSSDGFGWLKADENYQLPAEWLENMPAPEKASARIIASFDEEGFGRMGQHFAPMFYDPSYGTLSLAERALIGVVVSSINACPTCLIIQTHKLGEQIGDYGRARRLAVNYLTVTLSQQERAIADYSVKLTEQPGKMEEADMQALRDAGLSEARVFNTIELAVAFNYTNRMVSGYGMRPDDDFMIKIAPTD
jgi:uncharacterized peroxidase-related enzyme